MSPVPWIWQAPGVTAPKVSIMPRAWLGTEGPPTPGQGGSEGDEGLPPLYRRWRQMDAALGAHGSMGLPWSVGRWRDQGGWETGMGVPVLPCIYPGQSWHSTTRAWVALEGD